MLTIPGFDRKEAQEFIFGVYLLVEALTSVVLHLSLLTKKVGETNQSMV